MGFFKSSKLRKREFYWSKFSSLTNKKFIFSVKSKHEKIITNIVIHIQNSNFGNLGNEQMSYQGH
jgi:hypothetical protein